MQIKDEYVSAEDVETVRTICNIVGTRAARLSAVAIAATMVQTGNVQGTGLNDHGVKVGMDGSVIEYYSCKSPCRPKSWCLFIMTDPLAAAIRTDFEERMRGALRELIGEQAAAFELLPLVFDNASPLFELLP